MLSRILQTRMINVECGLTIPGAVWPVGAVVLPGIIEPQALQIFFGQLHLSKIGAVGAENGFESSGCIGSDPSSAFLTQLSVTYYTAMEY